MARGGRAFGLDLVAEFDFPGLSGPADDPADPVRLAREDRSAVLAGWPDDADVLSLRRRPDGRTLQLFEAHHEAGHLISWLGWGSYAISHDTRLVRCGPVRAPTWRWQRFLVGQVLPYVAVLRGHEVFHASAVAFRDHTVAFIGRSAAGKSSVAAALALRGWTLMADDVVALRVDDLGVLWAEAGPRLVSLRRDAADRMSAEDFRRLGRVIGRDAEAFRIEVPGTAAARPLTSVFVLERATELDQPLIRPLRPVEPQLLLGSSFNFIIRSPERLTRQLDVCARLASTVPVHAVAIRPDVGAGELATHLADHLAAGSAPRPAA